jgi:hypothetical protein
MNESIKKCYGVETSLIESTNGIRIKCVFKDSLEVMNQIDDFKENFYLESELSFNWLIWFFSMSLFILLSDYEQYITIVDLPFGRIYSSLALSVFDLTSGVTSKQTEESTSTKLIDTTISTLFKLIILFLLFNFI